MNWQVMIDSLPALLQGARVTLELVVLSGVLGIMIAVPTAMARVSAHWWVRALPVAHIYFFRGTPLLVQIYLVYYGLGQFEVGEGFSALALPARALLVRDHRIYSQYFGLYRRDSAGGDSIGPTG